MTDVSDISDVTDKSSHLFDQCLKGHKSLGSLCSGVRTLIVSLVRSSKQGTAYESSGLLRKQPWMMGCWHHIPYKADDGKISSVLDLSSTTSKIQICIFFFKKKILTQNLTRTIVFIVIGVYLQV